MPTRFQGSTTHPIPFRMVLASDHLTPATSLVPVVTISKDGGAFASAAGAVTEKTAGWYVLAGNATDRDTTGTLLLRAAVATADDAFVQVDITAQDPFAAGVVVTTNNDKTGYGLSTLETLVLHSGTAAAGGASTITLAGGASAVDAFYVGQVVKIYSGLGAGQTRVIIGYVGSTKVASTARAWAVQPDSTSLYAIVALVLPKVDASLQVTSASVEGNVTGTVASVTGAVGSVTGAVGSVTGAVGSVTGNVGGNVTGTVASVVTKTGYALTSGEHTLNVADAQAALTAQGYTTGRGPLLDHLDQDISTRATPAQVRTQVSGALTADTIAELAQGVPPVTPSVTQALALLYMAMRNGVTEDGTYKKVYNDAGVCIAKMQTTDSGTVFTVHKAVTGP